MATAKIGLDTNSHKFVLYAARFWLQCWLAVRTMPQDLIGCWNQRKLKALISRVVVFENDQPSAERRIDFAVFLVVLWSYRRKIHVCAMEIQKIQMVVHIFSGSALFTELMWVYCRVESLCKLLISNNV